MGLSDKIRGLAQEQDAEPVVVAAIFLRKGETASRSMGGLAPGASLGQWAESMQRAPQFPANTLIAVTEANLRLYEAKGGLKWKVKAPLGVYSHGSYQATDGGSGAITRFLTLTFLDGTTAELETQVSGAQKFQGEVIDELVKRSGAPLG